MQDLIAELEIRLVNTVGLLNEAELKHYYAEVLELRSASNASTTLSLSSPIALP
jgi:hypothetical protein